MKKTIFIGFTAFFALMGASLVHAETAKPAVVEAKDQKAEQKAEVVDTKSLLLTIDKLSDLTDRAQITLDRIASKGYDTVDADKLLQNAVNTLTIAHDGLIAKDAKSQISLKKAQDLVKTAKQALIDSLTALKAATDQKNN